MTPRRLLIGSVFFWCLVIVATPVLASYGGYAASFASLVYGIFSRICHQLDSHSFHLAGYKFAVCIRCFSIYCAFFFGIALMPMVSRTRIGDVSSRTLIVMSLIPMGVDVLLGMSGVHQSTTLTRIATGSTFGFGLGFLLASILEELFGQFISWTTGLKNKLVCRVRNNIHMGNAKSA